MNIVYLKDLPADVRLQYDTAGLYLKTLTGSNSTSFSIALLNSVVELITAKGGDMPLMREIVEYVVWRKPCSCQRLLPGSPRCLDQLDRVSCSAAMRHLIQLDITRAWTCMHIRQVLQYEILMKRKPSLLELHRFHINMFRFQYDHQSYCSDARVRVGTLVDRYICEDTETATCVLCQDEISGQKKYRLPCTHTFHAFEQDCIDGNIQKWFNENIQCPICRRDLRDMDPTLVSIVKT